MCGIIGMLALTPTTDAQLRLFRNLLYVDQIRGEHATGVMKVHTRDNRVEIHKKAVSATDYLAMQETKDFLEKDRVRLLVGHNRYATMGAKDDDKNAHPFQYKHITGVHNGTVDRWTLDKLVGFSDPDIIVDSNMVYATIAEHGIEKAVKEYLSGAFALVYWDAKERSLNMIRNFKRPLWLAGLNDNSLVWASEKEFIDFFVKHDKSKVAYRTQPLQLPANELHTWKFSEHGVLLNAGNPETKTLVFTQIPDPNPVEWYGMEFTGRRGGRVVTGIESFDARVNRLLSEWRLDNKAGDEVCFQIEQVVPSSAQNSTLCTVFGNYQNVDFEIYGLTYEEWKDADFGIARINNAREVVKTDKGVRYEELCITAQSAGARPLTAGEYKEVKEELAKKLKERTQKESQATGKNSTSTSSNMKTTTDSETTSSGGTRSNTDPTKGLFNIRQVQFPFRVNGFLFQDRFQMTDLLSEGCENCGSIPTVENPVNAYMTVYQDGVKAGGRPIFKYLCGNCCIGE